VQSAPTLENIHEFTEDYIDLEPAEHPPRPDANARVPAFNAIFYKSPLAIPSPMSLHYVIIGHVLDPFDKLAALFLLKPLMAFDPRFDTAFDT